MGIPPHRFYEMTFAEVLLAGRAYLYNQQLEWDKARTIIADVRNAGLIASGGRISASKLYEPKDIKFLPMIDPKPKKLDKEQLKAPKELWDTARKVGVVRQEDKPLSEIFKKQIELSKPH